jgi:hypothetical protein
MNIFMAVRVRRSFSLRSENEAKIFSLRSEKKLFRLFRFEAKHKKSQAMRNESERSEKTKAKRNLTEKL